MNYHSEMERCSVVILLRALVDADGNRCVASAALGIHRNTMSRLLTDAGWTKDKLREFLKEKKRTRKSDDAVARAKAGMRKPVQTEPPLFTNFPFERFGS